MSFALLGASIASCTPETSNPRSGTLGSSASSGGSSGGHGGSPAGSSSSSSSGGEMGGNGTGGSTTLPVECTNGVKDGQETDIDCGGPKCLNCVGAACTESTECASQVCLNGKCVPPSCSDNIRNGTETDIDCGGPDCPDCADNSNCKVPEDCKSSICSNNLCFSALVQ